MTLVQITYWIDTPDPSAAGSWERAWERLKSSGGKEISGIGDAAYFNDGRLTFQKGTIYFTVEAIDNHLDMKTAAGVSQQLEIEKRMAQDMLGRLG